MKFIIIFILILIIGGILFRYEESRSSDSFLLVTIFVLCWVIGGTGLVITGGMYFCTHNEACVQASRIKVERKYKEITNQLKRDNSSVVTLTSEITDYNTSVLTGRFWMDNPWCGDLEYPFWKEIPLIDSEEWSE